MIANVTRGNNFYGAALYNQSKIDKGEAQIIGQQKLLGTTPNQLDKYLNKIANASNTKNKVFHASLSFHPNDRNQLSIEQLNVIAREYMEQMGYGKQPYIIYRHEDAHHPHIHILSSRVDIETRKRIHQNYERLQSQKITRALEKKYGLTIATQQSNKQSKEHQDINHEVKAALKHAPATFKELNRRMEKMGSAYRLKEVGKGHIYYRHSKNKRISNSWKGSLFKEEGIDNKGLKKHFEENRRDRLAIKTIAKKLLDKKQPIPLLAFEKGLAKYNIGVKYAQNDKGIYGMSYQYKEKEFKGSDIDKTLSWNKLKQDVRGIGEVELREQLVKAFENGDKIGVKYQNNTYHFSSSNKGIADKLNAGPNRDSYKIAFTYNQQQKKNLTSARNTKGISQQSKSTMSSAISALLMQSNHSKDKDARDIER